MAFGSSNVDIISPDNLNRLCGQQISITFGGNEKQFFCFCWGVCRGRFFMTQVPVDSDLQDEIEPGTPAVVRFVESGMVCGFKTRVYRQITHPFRLLFFNYPTSIDSVNLRNSRRVSIFLDAIIRWKGEEYNGAIRDLSEGGCFFTMNYWQDEAFDDLTVGSTFPIKFTIHGEKAPTELECKTVRITRDQEELRMGISFVGGRPKTTGKIAAFIAYVSKLLENRA